MDLLSSPQGAVAILGPVVQTLMGEVPDRRHQLAQGRAIRPQLVGDDPLRLSPTLRLQAPDQKPTGLLRVPAHRDDLVQDVALRIDGTPEP